MKKYIFLGLFTLIFYFTPAQSTNSNYDSLKKEHGYLMGKANSFFSNYKSVIDSRIKKTERMVGTVKQDTTGAKGLIKAYQSDSIFYQIVIQKGDSLMQTLQAHDKAAINAVKSGEQIPDKFLFENEEKIDKVKWIISYAKDIGKQLEKRLKLTNKELKEMRDDAAKQAKKQQKKVTRK